eukprot:COSAG04_NODE_2054_length_4901_cov_1.544565_3_plen_220_part_00
MQVSTAALQRPLRLSSRRLARVREGGSLFGGKGGGRGLLAAAGREAGQCSRWKVRAAGMPPPEGSAKQGRRKVTHNHPTLVQGTNDSSVVSKCSMAALGYHDDPFLRAFVRKPSRRSPLVNRGYHVRANAVDAIARRFLRTADPIPPTPSGSGGSRGGRGGGGRQVVSLGAGFDTLFFRLQSSALLSPADVVYELDFPALVRRKLALIDQDPTMAELCG